MRILFVNRGHAERCLKVCRNLFAAEFSLQPGKFLPSQRVRNAFCHGLGYSSYDELARMLSTHESAGPTSSKSLFDALQQSFVAAFQVAHESGFGSVPNPDKRAARLSRKALRALTDKEPREKTARCSVFPHVRFYRSLIEGRIFFAGLSIDGPYVGDRDHSVCIGCSSIVERQMHLIPSTRPFGERWTGPFRSRWFVVKYSDERRIDLTSLSEQGRLEFSRQFGVPISTNMYGREDFGASFFRSEAFRTLCDWAVKHPRLTKRLESHSDYLPTLTEQLTKALADRT
jgi:hypothetical protein